MPPSTPFESLGAIEHSTRRERILDSLRSAVSSGELEPGTHLAETELSTQLGVSRGTLREALRHLQEEGLLSKDSRGRLSVRILTPQEVSDIFDVRYALESLAVTRVCAAEDLSPMLDSLHAALDRLKASETASLEEQVDADLAFHQAICLGSGNQTLVESWRRVSGIARASITAAGRETARENMSAARHSPILTAIMEHDVDTALSMLKEHSDSASERIVSTMRRRITPSSPS